MPDTNLALTRVERLILSNQLRILEALYPDEAKEYAIQREAFERGYEMFYSWGIAHIFEGDDALTVQESREVWATLEMFRALMAGALDLGMVDWLREQTNGRFIGYDGNDETKFMIFSSYTMEQLERFTFIEMPEGSDFNSHTPMREIYKQMLARWQNIPRQDRYMLSREQIEHILDV